MFCPGKRMELNTCLRQFLNANSKCTKDLNLKLRLLNPREKKKKNMGYTFVTLDLAKDYL
jgi:hypothetical protein